MFYHVTADLFVKAVPSCFIGHIRVKSDTQCYDIGHDFLFKNAHKIQQGMQSKLCPGKTIKLTFKKADFKTGLMLTLKVS